MVNLCLPGTGGMMPLPNRFLTCLFVEYMGNSLLIDCGESTQVAIKSAKLKISKLNTLLITHFHADHIAGLPGLLLTLGNAGKTTPLTIIGPKGLENVVSCLSIIAPSLPFEVIIKEIDDETFTFSQDGIDISVIKLKHAITCYGYRLDIKRKPIFNPQKAKDLAIPIPYYHLLHEGNSVTLDNGKVIDPSMVLDGDRKTMSIAYCTDTLPFAKISEFINSVDYYFGEGMYIDEEMKEKMLEKGHSTFCDSAKIAKAGNVENFVVTHFSPALTSPLEENIDNVKEIFNKTIVAFDSISFEI